MRCLQDTARVVLALWLALAPVKAWAGSMMLLGAGKAGASAPTYQGPGDVLASAYGWYSCTRAYSAAFAATQGNICDLVDSAAPTTPICTLKSTTSGFVDLTAYCTGSVTPAAKCAAATGGVCYVSQAYDQTGNGRHVVQTANANQPKIAFSQINSLPVMDLTSGAALVLATSATFTIAADITMSAVAKRTSGTSLAGIGGANAATGPLLGAHAANTFVIANGTEVAGAATDNTWIAGQGLLSNTAAQCAYNINGVDTTGQTCGTAGFAGVAIRVGRAGSQWVGYIAEFGMWQATGSPTVRGNLYTNASTAYAGAV